MASIRSAAGSEEDVGELFSDCFWEIKGYKQVVQRIDDGARLTDGLMQCIGERAELEMKYAKGLKTWAKKWEDATIKGPEYGSMVHTMKSLSREAEETADIHYEVRQKIVGSVIESVKHWKNGQYQKTFVKWKQTVTANEGFEKAQRPWSKRYIKVDKTKKVYHIAARNREQLKRQLELYEQDPMTTSESVKKLKDKLNKSISEADKSKEKYQDRLNDLNMSNQQYINEMSVEFEKCQALEKERITFFKKTLEDYTRYLDVSKNSSLANSFANVTQALDEVSVEEDLKKYADSKGTGMGMNWPKYVEFDETETYPPIGNLQFKEPESNDGNHYSVYDEKKSEPESKVDRLAWARGLSSQKYFKNTFGSSPPKGSPIYTNNDQKPGPIYTNNDQKPGPSNKGPSPTKPGPFTPKMLSVMRSAGSSLSSGSPVSKWFPFHSSTPPGVK